MVHGLEAEYWGRVDFIYLDRDNSKNNDAASDFGIRGQPVFILLTPGGEEIARWSVLNEDGMREQLDSALAQYGG